MKTLARGIAALALLVTGCTAILGEDFAGYAARPTRCDPRAPQDSDPRQFHRCPSGTTCLFAAKDGSPSTKESNCFSTVEPPLAPQASCKYDNDCGAGRLCTGLLGCAEFCTVGGSCTGDRLCLAFDPPTWLGFEEVGYCAFDECDPLGSTCAGTCSFYTMTNTACVLTAGAAALGEPCTFDLDCKRPLACSDTTRKCTHYCRLGAFADCPGGKACLPPATYLEWNSRKYGYCAL